MRGLGRIHPTGLGTPGRAGDARALRLGRPPAIWRRSTATVPVGFSSEAGSEARGPLASERPQTERPQAEVQGRPARVLPAVAHAATMPQPWMACPGRLSMAGLLSGGRPTATGSCQWIAPGRLALALSAVCIMMTGWLVLATAFLGASGLRLRLVVNPSGVRDSDRRLFKAQVIKALDL